MATSPSYITNVALPFFKQACHAAQLGVGYQFAGYRLTSYALQTREKLLEHVERLEHLVAAEDDDGLLQWFNSYFPTCMKLVPSERRKKFLRGVYQRITEERNAGSLNW